jgi:hypothetical protein
MTLAGERRTATPRGRPSPSKQLSTCALEIHPQRSLRREENQHETTDTRPLAFALLAFASAAAAAATHLDLSATLTASRGYCTADYSGDHGSREADINLTGTRRLAGQRVTIYLAGKKLGTVTVSRQGRMQG